MAGVIQVDVLRWLSDQQLAVRPFACPLADQRGQVDRQLYCFQVDQRGHECYCPYFHHASRATQPQYRTYPEFISRRMAEVGASTARYSVVCLAARATTPPGA